MRSLATDERTFKIKVLNLKKNCYFLSVDFRTIFIRGLVTYPDVLLANVFRSLQDRKSILKERNIKNLTLSRQYLLKLIPQVLLF
jgi:hypothetical protein